MINKEKFAETLRSLGAECNVPNAANLVDDSREVSEGDIFVLRQGAEALMPETAAIYAQKAKDAGAAAIIAAPEYRIQADIPVITIDAPHTHLRELAEGFYGSASHAMKMIAVTGTNGKTTTTYLIESLAAMIGLKIGVIGTISYRYPGFCESAKNTTPGTLHLYKLLAQMRDAHCNIAAMEVSSHSIVQGRIDGLAFDAAIWNNLGTDHLDFHKTREAYALAKQHLFDRYLAESFRAGKHPAAIGNADDTEVMHHIHAANPAVWGGRIMTYACTENAADVRLRTIGWHHGSWQIEVSCGDKTYLSALPLIGEYNISNAAAALTALVSLGYDAEFLAEALAKTAQIPGRMECICTHPTVIVDFAHTPEALSKALDAARSCVPEGGSLWIVFGAGGDRDPSKRPMMGKAASDKADHIIVTSDNPRTESPENIIAHILDGIDRRDRTDAIADRKLAIETALHSASDKDVVLIAGKGHEDYQILGTKKIHFDDRETVRQYYSKSLDSGV